MMNPKVTPFSIFEWQDWLREISLTQKNLRAFYITVSPPLPQSQMDFCLRDIVTLPLIKLCQVNSANVEKQNFAK